MVELLDPAGTYFGDRIIAQGASGQQDEQAMALTKRLMQVCARGHAWWACIGEGCVWL